MNIELMAWQVRATGGSLQHTVVDLSTRWLQFYVLYFPTTVVCDGYGGYITSTDSSNYFFFKCFTPETVAGLHIYYGNILVRYILYD